MAKKKFEKVVLLPDIHYPKHSIESMNVVMKFLEDFRPDEVVFMGDQLDMGVLSHWNKDKKKTLELKRLKQDYSGFDKDILKPIESLTKKITWITGNHEDWVRQYIDKEPGLEGLLEPELCLEFEERGIEYVPYNGIYKIGRLNVIHGYYANAYHAAKTVNAFHGNVCYAHTHSSQEHTKITPVSLTDYHTATALPCLCDMNPDYMKGRPSAWIHGFGIVYLFDNGDFSLYTVKIINNRFIFNDKVYGPDKKKTRM